MQSPAARRQCCDVDLVASRGRWFEEAGLEQIDVEDAAEQCGNDDRPDRVCASLERHGIQEADEHDVGLIDYQARGRIENPGPHRDLGALHRSVGVPLQAV